MACVYAWLYDGFPLLMIPVGTVIAAELFTERRLRPGIAVAALAGMAVGLVVNPYFPEYLTFMWHHMGDKLVDHETLRVGREWAPYDPLGLFANASAALAYVAFGVAVLGEGPLAAREQGARGPRGRLRLSGAHAALAALRRVLRTDGDLLRRARRRRRSSPRCRLTRRRLLVALLTVVLIANVVGIGSMLARRATQNALRPLCAPRPSSWRAKRRPARCSASTDWDDFPWIYFYNVESTYLIGLDPTYLRNRFRDAYWAWVDASLGRVPRPSDVFGARLPCAYVMSDRDHGGFLELAANDPGLEARARRTIASCSIASGATDRRRCIRPRSTDTRAYDELRHTNGILAHLRRLRPNDR